MSTGECFWLSESKVGDSGTSTRCPLGAARPAALAAALGGGPSRRLGAWAGGSGGHVGGGHDLLQLLAVLLLVL